MIPASSPSAIRWAIVRSFVKTYAARPYGVLFAAAITSSRFAKSSNGMTGAKGSSVIKRIAPSTSRTTVGSNQKPFANRVDRPPPVKILAPRWRASSIRPAVFSSALASNIGPTCTPSSRPLPILSFRVNSTAASVNSLLIDSWT